MSPAILRAPDLDELPRAAAGVHEAFLRAADMVPLVDLHYSIAGHHIRMLFAGSVAAATLSPAFAHLLVEARDEPDLTIHVSDAASSGGPLVDLPDVSGADAPGTWQVHAGADVHWGRQIGVDGLNVLSPQHRAAWFWTPDVERLPLFERAAPFRILWHWWLPLRSQALIHAAAIGTAERGLLLVGKGGSGKSTAALAAVGAGLRYAADDYVVASVAPPMSFSIFGSGKIDVDGAWRLPHLASLTGHRSDGHPFDTNKAVVFLSEELGDRLIARLPISAILVPRVTNAGPETKLVPGRPADALLALAPSTVLQMPGGGDRHLSRLSALVSAIPTYRLDMGTDVDGVVAAMASLLEGPLAEAS